MVAVKEMAIWGPTDIQCVGIPALLKGKNVVLGSDIESGATLAYLLPIIQISELLRAASARSLGVELETLPRQQFVTAREISARKMGVMRSESVGMGRIDEEEPYCDNFLEKNHVNNTNNFVYQRSKSYGILITKKNPVSLSLLN